MARVGLSRRGGTGDAAESAGAISVVRSHVGALRVLGVLCGESLPKVGHYSLAPMGLGEGVGFLVE